MQACCIYQAVVLVIYVAVDSLFLCSCNVFLFSSVKTPLLRRAHLSNFCVLRALLGPILTLCQLLALLVLFRSKLTLFGPTFF